MGCGCNSGPGCCDDNTPPREQGPPGPPGPPGVTPTFTIEAQDGAETSAQINQTSPNVWLISLIIAGNNLLASANTWLATNTFGGPTFFNAQVQLGTNAGPFPLFLSFGQMRVPLMGSFLPNSGECMVGRLGIDNDGNIKKYIGIAPNAVNNAEALSLVVTGNTPLQAVGAPLNFVNACTATLQVIATFDVDNNTIAGGIMPYRVGIYVDAVLYRNVRMTNYELANEVSFFIDALPAGAHAVQMQVEGMDPAATDTVEFVARTLDVRW